MFKDVSMSELQDQESYSKQMSSSLPQINNFKQAIPNKKDNKVSNSNPWIGIDFQESINKNQLDLVAESMISEESDHSCVLML